MSETLAILFVLLIVLTIVAVVGHGIWVFAAWFFRTIFGTRTHDAQSDVRCPRCKGRDVTGGRCHTCGFLVYQNEPTPTAPQTLTPLDECLIVTKHLRRLYESGAIDGATCASVIAALNASKAPTATPVSPTESAAASWIDAPEEPRVIARERPRHAPLVATPASPPPPVPVQPVEPTPEPVPFEEWNLRPIEAARPTPPPLPPPPARTPTPPRPPKPPRKPMSELLAAFMEESNIRWGELVGGLLIVGCSIALVFTFWDWIAVRPWFKFFLFTAITGSVFATGLYTEHRWRLPNTSRGLLLIATLLVPLNFLAIAAFSRDVETLAIARVGGELLAITLFAWLVFWAGKIITPGWQTTLSAGVLGASVCQVIVHRFAPTASPALVVALACLPLLFYLGSVAATLRSAWRWETITRVETSRLFTFLGAISFAAVIPLGLLAFNVPDFRATLERIAPAVGLYGLPALATGLFLWKRLENDKNLAPSRTAGTSITVLGAIALLGSLVIAWPNPTSLLCAGLLNFAILTAASMLFAIPAGHLLALPCATFAYLVAFHLVAGNITDLTTPGLLRTLLSATSGAALVPIVALIGIAAGYLKRRNRDHHARFYGLVSAAAAGLSLALVSWYGFGRVNDHGAVWVYAIYTAAALAATRYVPRAETVWAASILLAATLAQAMVFRFPVADRMIDRWTIAALTHASAMTALTLLGRSWAQVSKTLAQPLADAAIASSVIAASVLAIAAFAPSGVTEHARALAVMTLWLAAIWLLISTTNVLPMLFTAFQGALVCTVMLAVTSVLQGHTWYQGRLHPLIDPWTLQSHGVALGILSLIWIGVRLFAQRRIRLGLNGDDAEAQKLERSDRASRLLWPAWPTVDRCVTWLLFVAILGMSLSAVLPGIATELAAQSRPTRYAEHVLTLHQHARGWGAWLMLSVTIVALLGTLRETNSAKYVWAIVTALTCACALFAARWQDASASASALRWALAGYLLFTSAVVWVRDRVRVRILDQHWSDIRILTLALTIPPILALTIHPALATLSGTDLVGPATTSFFGSITSATSYLVPLALVTTVLVGHALRDRSPGFAFAAGLVLNLSVTLAYALWLTQNDITIGIVQQIRLVQLNVIASALFALAWAATWRFSKRTEDRTHALPPLLLQLHLALAAVAMLCLILPATWRLYALPQLDPATIAEVGNLYGWIAVLLTCTAAATMFWPISASAINAFGGATTLVAPLAAFTLCRGDTVGWTGFHALLIACAAAGWAILGLNWLAQLRSTESTDALDDSPEATRSPLAITRRSATLWASLFGGLTLALAFRALDGDPASPTWTLAGIAATSPLAVGLSIQTLRSEWLYPAGLLLNAAATIAWQHYARTVRPNTAFLELVQINALCLACTGLATLSLELFVLRPIRSQVVRRGFAPFHHLAAILSLILVSALGFFLMVEARLNPILTWSTLAATLALLTATLWDEDATYSIKGLYTVGLAALASAFPLFYRSIGNLFEITPLALAAYSLLCGFLFTQRTSLARFAESTGIPLRRTWPSDRAGWLAGVTIILAGLVSLLAFGQIVGRSHLFMELGMGTSVIAMAVAIGLMARSEQPTFTHYAALVFAALGAVYWGWAWVASPWLVEGVVVAMVVLAVMTVAYAVGLIKILRTDDVWTRTAHNLAPLLGTLAITCLFLILGIEFAAYRPTGTPIATPAAIAVVLAFVGLAAGCIVCAVVPGKDPFDLSERGRTIYVYAAEVLLILLFVHCKLVWPDLLQIGIWRRYWPVIIVLISFLGVGLAEVFRRQNRMVLAEPIERSGAILPVVPLITFFMFDSHRGTTNYAHVLFLTGIVYGALAVMRKSFAFGVLAALAGNGGLWYLLHHTQHLGFASHPQLWLIPAALSVLAAAQLNKDRLSTDQMRVIRYITMMIVYASSTADILIARDQLAAAPHLPLILATLSVTGVMIGILLHIQSFLFLGTTFLVIAIAAMIHYATLQVGGSWPWLIAGILLGAAIVTLFALFEKKRNDMLALVEGLKEWQG